MLEQHNPKNVLVAGANGMVGSAICRALAAADIAYFGATRADCDFRYSSDVDKLFSSQEFDYVVIAAAKVGGIHANDTYPADFLLENLQIETTLIDGAYRRGIKSLLFLGSSCIYPKFAAQPMTEEMLLTGELEPTNEPYAIAKIAGIKLCESYNRQFGTDYRSLMPTNLFGQGDNYHPENSHVIPALMRRIHEAKLDQAASVTVWGTGTPKREFLNVDDLANACVKVIQTSKQAFEQVTEPNRYFLNVGVGEDVSIRNLAELLVDIIGFEGKLIFDSSMPDGTPRKLLDITKLVSLNWQPSTGLREGLERTYADFQVNETREK